MTRRTIVTISQGNYETSFRLGLLGHFAVTDRPVTFVLLNNILPVVLSIVAVCQCQIETQALDANGKRC